MQKIKNKINTQTEIITNNFRHSVWENLYHIQNENKNVDIIKKNRGNCVNFNNNKK